MQFFLFFVAYISFNSVTITPKDRADILGSTIGYVRLLQKRDLVILSHTRLIIIKTDTHLTPFYQESRSTTRSDISSSQNTIIFGTPSQTLVYIWNQTNYTLIQQIGQTNSFGPSISGDGLWICAPTTTQIQIFSRSTQIQNFTSFHNISLTNQQLSSGSESGQIFVASKIFSGFNLHIIKRSNSTYSLNSLLGITSFVINSIKINKAGTIIFFTSSNNLLTYDIQKGQLQILRAGTSFAYYVTVNKNETKIIITYINSVQIFDYNGSSITNQMTLNTNFPIFQADASQKNIAVSTASDFYLYCIAPRFISSTGQCLSQCPLGFRQSGVDDCEICSSNCIRCNSSQCIECKQGTFLSLGLCVSVCPNGEYGLNKTCVRQCTLGLYGDNLKRQCVKNCSNGLFYQNNSRLCLNKCPQFYQVQNNRNICVKQCRQGQYKQNLTSQCVKNCPKQSFAQDINGYCSKQCPQNYFKNRSTNVCQQQCQRKKFLDYFKGQCLDKLQSINCQHQIKDSQEMCNLRKYFNVVSIILNRNIQIEIFYDNVSQQFNFSQLNISKVQLINNRSDRQLVLVQQYTFYVRKQSILVNIPQNQFNLSKFQSLQFQFSYKGKNYKFPKQYLDQKQILKFSYPWAITFMILSIILLTLNLLLRDCGFIYSIAIPWQLAYLMIYNKSMLSSVQYSIFIGLSFTGLNFFSPFTTQIWKDNNFFNNAGITVIFLFLLLALYLTLTFLKEYNRLRHLIWQSIKLTIPTILYFFAIQFDSMFDQNLFTRNSSSYIGSKFLAVISLLFVLALFHWSVYGLYLYGIQFFIQCYQNLNQRYYNTQSLPLQIKRQNQPVLQINSLGKFTQRQFSKQDQHEQRYRQSYQRQVKKQQIDPSDSKRLFNNQSKQKIKLQQNAYENIFLCQTLQNLSDCQQMAISMMIGVMAYINNSSLIFVFHFLWLPSLLFIYRQQNIYLWALNQIMISLILWDQYIGITIILPITIIVCLTLLMYKQYKKRQKQNKKQQQQEGKKDEVNQQNKKQQDKKQTEERQQQYFLQQIKKQTDLNDVIDKKID